MIDQTLTICPECGSKLITNHDRGELVCNDCGAIIAEHIIDPLNKRRSYSYKESKTRNHICPPISTLNPDISFCTIIEKKNINNPNLKRAVIWDSHLSWNKRNKLIALTELKRISSNLNIPKYIKETTLKVYEKAVNKELLKGRSINGMISASLYYACRKEKFPISIRDIFNNSNLLKLKDIIKSYSVLMRNFNLKVPPIDPLYYIPKLISDLGLSQEIENDSIELLKTVSNKLSINGKNPKGYSAASIYLICKFNYKKISQKEISRISGISEVTLRSRSKDLLKYSNLIQKILV